MYNTIYSNNPLAYTVHITLYVAITLTSQVSSYIKLYLYNTASALQVLQLCFIHDSIRTTDNN